MGKRQIGEMQPFEFVITILIANLACISMEDIQKPLLYGIVAIITLLIAHHSVVFLIKKFLTMRNVFEGNPVIVISPGGIDFKQLKKSRITISDLIESMRVAGYFSFDEVSYGIYETNGKFSAIASNLKKNNDLTKQTTPPTLPLVLIELGKINKHNLDSCGINEEWIKLRLEPYNIKSLKSVSVLTLDNTGNVYLQIQGESFTTFSVKYNRETAFRRKLAENQQ